MDATDAAKAAKHSAFLDWFTSSGGMIGVDSADGKPLWTLHDYRKDGMGTGLRALAAMPENTLLFSLPRSMLLNTRNCPLPSLVRQAELDEGDAGKAGVPKWDQLESKWASLIICMLWERRRSLEGRSSSTEGQTWGPYLDVLPVQFATPMFWPAQDLRLLKGTSIENKIGQEEAEAEYSSLILPLVNGRPELFLPNATSIESGLAQFYSLELFHIMGSRILSRSFHVEPWREEHAKGDDLNAMETDDDEEEYKEGDEAEEEDKLEAVEDISMVAMADMLNARPGDYHNAKLFYRPTHLEMRTTRGVKQGEQLYNTYADPPNSDLLRRYGHVDTNAAPDDTDGTDELDNPNDNVELHWDLVAEAAMRLKVDALQGNAPDASLLTRLKSRINRYESEGLMPDECMVLSYIPPLSAAFSDRESMLAFLDDEDGEYGMAEFCTACRLMWVDDTTYEKYEARGEEMEAEWKTILKDKSSRTTGGTQGGVSEGQANADTAASEATLRILCARLALEAVTLRLAQYETTLEQDEDAYRSLPHSLPHNDEDFEPAKAAERSALLNRRNALVVRVGEKRILSRLQVILQAAVDKYNENTGGDGGADASGASSGGQKRRAEQDGDGKVIKKGKI
ncbi:SET domain-containing protein [Tilletiaria anomala UBC 951]|uniref:SET domain-containing protein n=1 Tax=Tilletiaria anomala (strain ATCC 24038 / CBS 436.72 / UBC 951) TaxID=1037660 RepID=A0A066WBM2_TILAU|nr:SET domain-containing protein [Tilletiaria anomala UBC 951]KDN48484.1 SET domain-containing protein [Tilletiaria anomala UBC 951]